MSERGDEGRRVKSESKRIDHMMKLKWIVLVILASALLAACGGAADEVATSETETTADAFLFEEDGTDSMPVQSQLILGTFLLEETDLAVDAQQASELLPLWKAVRSLGESDTAAAEEIEAVINQIQETMTSEQLETINTMEISREDMTALMEDLDITSGFAGGQGNNGEFEPSEGSSRRFSEGGFPEGGFPEGGFAGRGEGSGAGGLGELSPEQMATMEALREERGGRAGMFGSQFLLDPLIELLEEKVG